MSFLSPKTFLIRLFILVLFGSISVGMPNVSTADDTVRQLKFEHLTSKDGLNQNSITRIFKDSAGMLWVGTQDGLHSYTNKGFKSFTHNQHIENSISESYITDIAQDKYGYLWITTSKKGLNRLDLSSGLFQSFGIDEGLTELETTKVMTIGDSLWIGTRSGLFSLSLKTLQINKINLGNSFTPNITSLANLDNTYLLVGTAEDGVFSVDSNSIVRLNLPSTQRVSQIRAMSNQMAVLAIGGALWQYDLIEHKGKRIWWRENETTEQARINDFTLINQNEIWLVGSNAGLVHLSQQDNQWHASTFYHQRHIQNSLSSNTQITLLYDTQGILWLGGDYTGLDRVNLERQFFTHYLDSTVDDAQQSNMIRGIFRSKDGTLWLGTEGGGLKSIAPGEERYRYHDDLFKQAIAKDPLPKPIIVRDILQDQDDNLWFSTNYGVASLRTDQSFVIYTLGQTQPLFTIRSLFIDSRQRIWAGTDEGLYTKGPNESAFSPLVLNESLQAPTRIFKIVELSENFWIATNEGLFRLNTITNEYQWFKQDSSQKNSLSDDRVRDILIASDDELWLGTHGGINRVTQLNGTPQFEHFTTNNGLPSNTIYALLKDDESNIWFSSNEGISRLTPKTGDVITYNEAEGLQGLEFNGAVKWQDANGDMWFGGLNGANRFSPQSIPSQRPESAIALTSYKIAGKRYERLDLSYPPEISMDYDQQVITFDVTSLDYNYPDFNQFSFFLEGFDKEWSIPKSGGEATYTNLSPGHYLLHVRQKLANNPQNDYVLTIKLQVISPFYLTPQAYALYLIAALLALTWILFARHQRRIEQRKFDHNIKRSEERLKLALWASGDGMWDWNIPENKVYRTNLIPPINAPKSEQTLIDNIHSEDKARVKFLLNQHLEGKTPFFEAEYRIENYPGHWIWLLDRGKVVETDSHNNPIRMAGTHKNITARKIAENELRLSSQVLQSMNEAVVVGELNYRIISVNPAFSLITGFKASEVNNKHFLFLTLGRQTRSFYQEIEKQLLRHKHWSGELLIRTRSKKSLLVWLEINQVIDNNGDTTHFVAVFTDITDRKKAEEDLRILASFDTLTGLPNRTLFQDRLTHAVAQANRNHQIVALMFLDLDRFKHINDSMGHHIGDLLLKAVSNRLQNTVREGDTVARLGGDEFTIILEGVAKIKAATLISEKLLRAFQTPFRIEDHSLTITPSIGISIYPDDATDAESLVKYADTAMYHAKSLGRNNFQFYTASLNEYAIRHVQIETGLKQAFSRNEFQLVYQPKFRISDGHLVGVEALLRWHSEELGTISPAEFIPLAEETGMINQIGHWVINQACTQMALWIADGYRDIHVAVNLSARQLKADIVSTIEVALALANIPASALELELTESMIMTDPEGSVATLSKLKSLGITLAVDDFGTGYSSLSYLKRFPIDTLKIDREFVRDITNDPDDASITSAIIALAHSLDLKVVAEGVEIQAQLNYLAEQNCDEVQGFLLSRPLSVADFKQFMMKHQRDGLTISSEAGDQ